MILLGFIFTTGFTVVDLFFFGCFFFNCDVWGFRHQKYGNQHWIHMIVFWRCVCSKVIVPIRMQALAMGWQQHDMVRHLMQYMMQNTARINDTTNIYKSMCGILQHITTTREDTCWVVCQVPMFFIFCCRSLWFPLSSLKSYLFCDMGYEQYWYIGFKSNMWDG